MISASDLSAAELSALMHFHADAGVEWLLEESPVDRFAEFADFQAAREAARAPSPPPPEPDAGMLAAPQQKRTLERPATPRPMAPVAIPDEQAVAEARSLAAGANSLSELKLALDSFNGCNLKHSARLTVFASGDPASGIMVIGPMPNAEDDRDGVPFSGRHGQLLDRMLLAIGLKRDSLLLTNVLPWRPPGNRMPSAPEIEICRPFIERQIVLAAPKAVLLLGNFTARFFFGSTETIHMMRGQWRTLSAGDLSVPALASLHPQELLTAPANKGHAWQDLLAFQARIDS
jgi:DNA polymerase